jgi:hypothetical protein
MQTAAPPIPISLFPMLPVALRRWAQPLEPVLWRLLVPGEVTDGFDLARRKGAIVGFAQRLLDLVADIEDLSLSIADIESDGRGVPVLIRQYLKMGGRLLGFNVDPSFSNALDALIVSARFAASASTT